MMDMEQYLFRKQPGRTITITRVNHDESQFEGWWRGVGSKRVRHRHEFSPPVLSKRSQVVPFLVGKASKWLIDQCRVLRLNFTSICFGRKETKLKKDGKSTKRVFRLIEKGCLMMLSSLASLHKLHSSPRVLSSLLGLPLVRCPVDE